MDVGRFQGALETACETRAQEMQRRVEAAVDELLELGCKVSFYSVAKRAAIARSTLYRRADLKSIVEEGRAKSEKMPPLRTEKALIAENAYLRGRLAFAQYELEGAKARGLGAGGGCPGGGCPTALRCGIIYCTMLLGGAA